MFECELCGFGYAELDMAERCEKHCDSIGSTSLKLSRQAIRKPPVEMISVVA